jgi:predicted AlkP superfamily phosphohydrolase/phosphomutase
MVSCFLTPSTDRHFTWPPQLRDEVRRVAGDYILDVDDLRSHDKSRIAQQLFDMTEQQFTLARHLATTRPWKLLIVVDMGPDRLHHDFWSACDLDDPTHQPGNRFVNLFRDYYRALDRHLERLLEELPERTVVLVASDHGAQPMVGGFCLNEWLLREGLLALERPLTGPTPIDQARIDWSNTIAWGDGGYYGLLFLNVAGREPNGTVAPRDYEMVRQRLIDQLEALPDHRGRSMGTRAMRPEELYPEVCRVPPDLIIYFGDLAWRSIGRLGLGEGLYLVHNDTGRDDAHHGQEGMILLAGDGLGRGRRDDISIFDVAPTLQGLLGLPDPPGQRGRRIA